VVNRRGAVIVFAFALSMSACHGPPLTRVDRTVRFDRTSADAIVVFGFREKADVWLAGGIDDGVNWACGTGEGGSGQQIWHLRSENGFVVARLPPRTGKYKYAIRWIGDGVISRYRTLANGPVWVFNAEPGKVSYVGAVRIVWTEGTPAIVEDNAVTEKDADEFVTRTFPNVPEHVVSRPMSWIYMGMNCR
jgi:hypothetical protein